MRPLLSETFFSLKMTAVSQLFYSDRVNLRAFGQEIFLRDLICARLLSILSTILFSSIVHRRLLELLLSIVHKTNLLAKRKVS